MRKFIEPQMKFGDVDISNIKFDLRSRDQTTNLLIGLQYIYTNKQIRSEIIKLLEKLIPDNVSMETGRDGMSLWKILVLGSIRINSNIDYDYLHNTANNHREIRYMLGHGKDDEKYYPLNTLKDNVRLLTPEILDKINEIVVKEGHSLVKKNAEEILKGRCDSFVFESNVHYPTDINLLLDAMRKVIKLTYKVSLLEDIDGWRQWSNNFKKVKKGFNKIRRLKKSTSKKEETIAKKEKLIKTEYKNYIKICEFYLARSAKTIKEVREKTKDREYKLLQIEGFIAHAERQIDHTTRRVLQDEVIPHSEKVFSIFEDHTEWISKGKAGVPQELGLKVCILEDNHGFILTSRVMQHEQDVDIAVEIARSAKEKFPNLKSCSFDRGFYRQDNKIELNKIFDTVIMPKKGKLKEAEKEEEYSEEFIKERHQHSAVESAINALENHGLDRCYDKGLDGFERYVAIAVVARNLQILGNIIQQKELKKLKKRSAKKHIRKLAA